MSTNFFDPNSLYIFRPNKIKNKQTYWTVRSSDDFLVSSIFLDMECFIMVVIWLWNLSCSAFWGTLMVLAKHYHYFQKMALGFLFTLYNLTCKYTFVEIVELNWTEALGVDWVLTPLSVNWQLVGVTSNFDDIGKIGGQKLPLVHYTTIYHHGVIYSVSTTAGCTVSWMDYP